jgi:drug/metabolite transporter (DMT)-like permease
MPPAERRALFALVLATLLWGATFVVIRDALSGLPPLPLVFGRFVVAAALLWTALALLGLRPDRETWRGGAASGALGACAYLFQAIGLEHTAAGTSAFLTSAGSLCAGLFAWPLLGQRPGRVLAEGLLLAFLGSALLSLDARAALGGGERWTLAGALLFGLQIVVLARVAPRTNALALAAVQALVLALVLAPFAIGRLDAFRSRDAATWLRFLYLAVPAGALAPLLQVVAQRTLAPGRVGLLLALEPVFALLFALTLGGERFVPRWWIGAALILTAVWRVEGRAARATRAHRRATS